jgi:outer membrane lipoprotein-sorting protein
VYEIFNELNRIVNEPVSEESLKAAKTFLVGNFSRSLERSGTLADFAINIDKYKLPKDYYKNYLKRMEAVTVADVQAAARKYIQPENAWIVVTGDKAHAEKLLPFASDQTIHYYDYDANPVAAPVTQGADISAETIIANYVKALGGKAVIDKITDFTTSAEVSAMGQKLSLKQIFKAPNKMITNMEMNGMSVQRIAFDGTTLRMSGMGGSQEFSEGDIVEKMKTSAAGIAPELNYIKNGYTLSVGDLGEVNGEKVYVLTAVKGSNKSVGYFDVKTGLKVKSVDSMDTPMGEQQTLIEYSDYREVEGVKFPFSMKQNMAGMTMEMTVKSVEINKGIEDPVFQ